MQIDDVGDNNAPGQQDGAGDNNAPGQQDAGDNEDSILKNLSPLSGDSSSMDSEEYNRMMKELEDEEKAEAESTPPKQVLATVTGLDEGTDSETNPPNAGIPGPSDPGAPHRVRSRATPEPGQGVALTSMKGCQWRNSPG
jgi:hypothetical protein